MTPIALLMGPNAPRRVRTSQQGNRIVSQDRIVAVGFLSEADLARLGSGFTRHFPVTQDDLFADLLAKLDDVEAIPVGEGVMLQHHHQIL